MRDVLSLKLARSRPLIGFGAAILAVLLGSACNRPAAVSDTPQTAPEIQYGTPVVFASGGNSEPYKASGWSKSEEKFTWSEGTSAQLRFSVSATTDAVTLKMRLAALVKPPELPFQPVEIEINGKKIADWQVADTSEFAAAIPSEFTTAGGLWTITIKTPKATSPKNLGLSADMRTLGICCLQLELAKG